VKEDSGTGVSPYVGPVGGSGEGDRSIGNFERWMKGALWMGRLSEEVQCGGLFTGDHEKYVRKIYQERRKNAL
jgi:hypothetical protein